MSKLGSCSSATTKGSITASQLRHNLIPKPPINAQKNVGLKSSLKDVHGSQGKAKTGLDNPRLPAKELAQKTVRILTHSSSKATSSTKSQLVQVDKANSGLEMVPDRLQSCEIQDESTPLAAKSLAQYTPTTSVKNNSLPSGLRLPSPSLRFFDQTTTSESASLQQKRIRQSNRQSGELRPPTTPKTPSGQCSVLNSLSTPCSSTQMSPSSNYMVNKGVLNSNVYPDIVRKMQYECRDSDVDSHKVSEQEKRILGHKDKMGMEKIALKGDEDIKVSHLIEQNGEGINASIQLSGNDERVPFVLETKDEFVLHNEEDKLQNYAATSVSTSGQSIQHQDQNILTMVDGSADFMQDLAQTSEGLSVNCIMPAVSSSLEEGPCAIATEINDHLFLEESGSTYSSTMLMEVPDQKQPLAEVPLEFIEVAPLIDDCLLRPEVELINGNISVGEDALLKTESVLRVAQCASTYPQSLEEERLDIIPATIEAEFKNNNDNQKHQEMGIIIGSLLTTTHRIRAEESKISFGEEVEAEVQMLQETKSPTMLKKRSNNIKRQDNSLVRHPPNTSPFSDEWLAALEAGCEDVVQTSRGQADSEKNDAPEFHLDAGSLEAEDRVNEVSVESHRDIIGKKDDAAKVVDENCLPMEDGCNTDTSSNYSSAMLMEVQSLEENQMHHELGMIIGNMSDRSDVYEHDTKQSNPIVPEQCIIHGCDIENTNVSTNILSMVQGGVSDCKGVDKPNEAQGFVGIMPSMETNDYFTNRKSRYGLESCGKDPFESNSYFPVSQQPTTSETTSTCTTLCSVIPESCLVAEGAEGLKISFGEEVEAEVLQAGKNKDATVLMKRSNNINMQDSSLVIHPPNAFDESLAAIEAPGEGHAQSSKVSYGEEVEVEVFQEGKNKDATGLMKRSNNINRQDNKSLVIHAVPFSDEWLAAIEAAGEEILTMKRGAVQHSPPDKSIPERNPWSPVKNKANQIGPYDCTKYTNAMPSNPHLSDS